MENPIHQPNRVMPIHVSTFRPNRCIPDIDIGVLVLSYSLSVPAH